MGHGSRAAILSGLTPGILLGAIGLVSLVPISRLAVFILGALVGVLLLIVLWFSMTRGTYITIDKNENLYSTSFFIKRDVIPLSNLISLSARHPLLLSGKITEVWNTYRNDKGKIVTKNLVSRQTLRPGDFKDLIERIRKANPRIEIAEELLK